MSNKLNKKVCVSNNNTDVFGGLCLVCFGHAYNGYILVLVVN